MYNVGLENEEVVQALKVSAGNKARKAAMLAGAYHVSFFISPPLKHLSWLVVSMKTTLCSQKKRASTRIILQNCARR